MVDNLREARYSSRHVIRQRLCKNVMSKLLFGLISLISLIVLVLKNEF
jgi:hypothetical protein